MARGSSQRSRTRRWHMVVMFGCILVAAVFLFLPGRMRRPKIEPPPELDPALILEVEQAWVEAASRVDPRSEVVGRLDRAMRARSRQEFAVVRAEPGAEARMAAASRECQQLMGDTLAELGDAGYRDLGVLLMERTVAALEAGLVQARASRGIEPFLAGLGEGTLERRDIEELYGSFLFGVAMPNGMVRSSGEEDPKLTLYARIILLYRWLNEAGQLKDMELDLSPEEKMIFLRWRVERAIMSKPDTRLEALDELVRLEPDYPAENARRRIMSWGGGG